MICIVLGHVLKTGFVRQVLYSFSVPFFFFLIGITYKYKSDIKQFYKDKAKRIVVPYICFAIISILLFNLLGEFASTVSDSFATTEILPNICGALYGNSRTGYMKWNIPLWFLTCLLACYILIDSYERFVIRKQTKEMIPFFRWGFIFGGIVLSNVLSVQFNDIMLPFQFETAFLMASFTELALLLKNSDAWLFLKKQKNKSYIVGFVIAVFVGVLISLLNGSANAQLQLYGKSMCQYFASSIFLGGGMMALSFLITKSVKLTKVFSYIGRHTMGILLMHKFPVLLFQTIIPYSNNLLVNKSSTVLGCIWGIIVTIIVIALCLLVEKIINPILPWMFGNKKEYK